MVLQTMRFGACVMLKNEEGNLRETFECLDGLIDLYLILDTGCTDKTIEECKALLHGKRWIVLYKTFDDDFSECRNFMMDYMETTDMDILLHIDAKDRLIWRDRDEVISHLKSIDKTVLHITSIWTSEGANLVHTNTKIVRNRKSLRFTYPIHEIVNDNDYTIVDRDILRIEQDRRGEKGIEEKLTFYRRCFEKYILNVDSLCLRSHFYLGNICAAQGENETAKIWFDRLISIHNHTKDYKGHLKQVYKTRAFLDGYADLKFMKLATERFPESIELSILMTECYAKNGMWKECLDIVENLDPFTDEMEPIVVEYTIKFRFKYLSQLCLFMMGKPIDMAELNRAKNALDNMPSVGLKERQEFERMYALMTGKTGNVL
jgi:hypothetical protein